MCSAAGARKRRVHPQRFWSEAFQGRVTTASTPLPDISSCGEEAKNRPENGARPAIKTASAAKRPERKRAPAGTGRGAATTVDGNLSLSSAGKRGEICRSVSRQYRPK